MVESKRDSDVSPVHIKRVKFQAVLADIEAEFHARIFRKVVHEGSLQVRKFVIEIEVQKPNRIAQIKDIANVSRTSRKHPTRRSLMAFGMELCRKCTDLDARLAEPFFHGILTARTSIHLEHGAQAIAVLRRESALVELHIVNAFDEECAEKPKEMHRRIDDRIVKQE